MPKRVEFYHLLLEANAEISSFREHTCVDISPLKSLKNKQIQDLTATLWEGKITNLGPHTHRRGGEENKSRASNPSKGGELGKITNLGPTQGRGKTYPGPHTQPRERKIKNPGPHILSKEGKENKSRPSYPPQGRRGR